MGVRFLFPKWFLLRAAVLLMAYAFGHLLGLRAYGTFLSGTPPTENPADWVAVALGCTYVVLHFAALLVAPIFILTALISAFAHALGKDPPRAT
jgi:hypothetical protein